MSDYETDTDFAAEPVEPDVAAEEPAADAPASAIDYSAPEFQDAIRDTLGGVLPELLQGMLAQPQEEQEEDDGTEPWLRDLIRKEAQAIVRGEMEPILPTVEEFQERQRQDLISDLIDNTPAIAEAHRMLPEDTDQDTSAIARQIAYAMMPGFLERYRGDERRAAQAALGEAGNVLLAYTKAVDAAGYQRRNAEMLRRGDTREPVPAGAAEGVQIREASSDVFEVADRFAARFSDE